MIPPGRPKGSAPLERSERETHDPAGPSQGLSAPRAQREGNPMIPPGRPKGSGPLERSERETQ
jgi:hypothetical protein